MAHSLGYKVFTTDSIEEMPFEQFRVLVHAMAQQNKQLEESMSNGMESSVSGGSKSRTTFRIGTEE